MNTAFCACKILPAIYPSRNSTPFVILTLFFLTTSVITNAECGVRSAEFEIRNTKYFLFGIPHSAFRIPNLIGFPQSAETAAKELIPTTLPNGMRLLILERPHTDTVTINAYIGIGRINEPESGAANLLLHMLFRGSKKYPPKADQEITKEVARMGGILNYHVGFLSTLISLTLPSNEFDNAISLLADIVLNPVLDTDELEKERTLILQKLAILKDFPANRFFRELMLRQFPDHPFGRGSEGTEDSVKKLNAELLKSYHKRFYVPDNISVVIVGNIAKDVVEAKLCGISSEFKVRSSEFGVIPQSAIRNPQSTIRILLNEHVTQAQIFIGKPVPGLNQKERHILLVMNQVLSGLNGRLFKTLRNKRGCVYSVDIWEAIYPEIGLWGIYAGTKTSELRATERLIVSELKRLIQQPMSYEELLTAQRLLETTIRTGYETNSSIAREIGSSLVKGETILNMEERIKLVQSVTADDIRSLAEKLFGNGEFNVIIMK